MAWQSKNVPNDELDLAVPIYDTDVCFYTPVNGKKRKRDLLVTCTGHGELRLYDPVQSVKPVARADVNKGKVLHKVVFPQEQDLRPSANHYVLTVSQDGHVLVCSIK